MNTTSYMDKQIMDLSQGSSSPQRTDFLDLINNNHHHQHLHGGDDDRTSNNDDILASYDFQPIRPLADRPKTSSPIRESQSSVDSGIVAEIDKTMKRHSDNLMHALEGVSARLTQLESRTRQLESSVDDLKVSVGNNHGATDGKLRQLENILREVQSGVQVIKDKQEIADAQLQLAKLQFSKVDHHQETQTQNVAAPVDSVVMAASSAASAPQQHPHHNIPPPVNHAPFPPPNAPPQPPPPVQLPTQFPQTQIPQRDQYFTQEPPPPNQQYQMPPHQQFPPTPQPQFSQPPPPPPPPPPQPQPQQPQHSQLQPQLSHHPEEPSYIPPQTYPPPNHRPPPSQQFYGGPPPQTYDQPPPQSSRSNSGFSFGYGPPPAINEPYHHGMNMKTMPLSSPTGSQGSGGGYPQLPTARVLPHALPAAASSAGGGGGGGSGSSGSGNRVPVDDVIDKVTTMGFPRDLVRATVRKLTENGQAVDLNIVLDKLMNDGDGQPPRGWFGR